MKNGAAQARDNGISANALVMPIIVVISTLHILIIVVILMINSASSNLSAITRNVGIYTQDATSLLAGSSLLSETSSNYILMPLTEAGEVNVSPLQAYAAELEVDRRGDQVLGRFQGYQVTEEELSYIEDAAKSANYMLDTQLHAISLIFSVYPYPDIPPLTSIPLTELSEEELAMTDAQKEAKARTLVLGSIYGMNKQTVSRSVNACVDMLRSRAERLTAAAARRVSILRSILWIATLSIICIIAVTFIALYREILFPLGNFVRQIPENLSLDESRGFKEVRLVAAAYNEVLKKRDALDSILRSAAETDALTNMPNRYRFEQYILEAGDRDHSLAVLLFDVNYLKKTNDTMGHLAGDKLIRTAAECISSCFGENCFRFGGDEFAAVVEDCTPEAIDRMVERFKEKEKARNVSISLGYAYAEEIGETTFRRLLDEADKNMYANKEQMHKEA